MTRLFHYQDGPYLYFVLAIASLLLAVPPTVNTQAAATCQLTSGRWVRQSSPVYSGNLKEILGHDCSTRQNKAYLQYSFTAPGCSISRVDKNPEAFLKVLSGKKLLIVGDSIATNLHAALAWSIPTSLLQSPATRDLIYSPKYKATVQRINSPFYSQNGGGRVYVGNLDAQWTQLLASANYLAIIGFRHFFHRDITFYKNSKQVLGYSRLQAVRDVSISIRDHLQAIKFNKPVFVFTYSPAHLKCSKEFTPLSDIDVKKVQNSTVARSSVSSIMQEVFGKAGANFRILDINRMASFRADSHPGSGSTVNKDCSHWCVPGVPNTWADIMFSIMQGKF